MEEHNNKKFIKSKIFALVDCNNFYASCERVFNPKLKNKPIVILSSNDGIIIAQSNEAKALGLKRGLPAFKCSHQLEKHKAQVFSSNFTLYGDMSYRVMETLRHFVPEVEIYSIDEAFLHMTNLKISNPTDYCQNIRKTVKKWTGIPVSIGIGPTKTLAKTANKIAKNNPKFNGVLDLTNHPDQKDLLESVHVSDIWGVGRQYSRLLEINNIKNALQLKNCPDKWIQKNMTITGLRTIWELRGISCINMDEVPPPNKQIVCSRSFGTPIEALHELSESVATYTARAAEKLRLQGLATSKITVYIMTNRFKTGFYHNSATITLPEASSYTPYLITQILPALKSIYKSGYQYKKAGVMFSNLINSNSVQTNIFRQEDIHSPQNPKIMNALDKINHKWGRGTMKLAAEGISPNWKTLKEKLSPRYTTQWSEIPNVSAK